MNGKSKGKRSRRRKMLARLMALPPERRGEDVKTQCGNLRHKMVVVASAIQASCDLCQRGPYVVQLCSADKTVRICETCLGTANLVAERERRK